MSEVNHWLVVADALKAARRIGMLTVCTCGAPGWADGLCGHCRLEAAEGALSKLRGQSLIQEKRLELLRDSQERSRISLRPEKRRAIVRRRLDRSLARMAENPPDCLGEAAESVPLALQDSLRSQVIDELTNVLSAGAEWETDVLEEAMVEMVKQLGLDTGLWELDDGPWAMDEGR